MSHISWKTAAAKKVIENLNARSLRHCTPTYENTACVWENPSCLFFFFFKKCVLVNCIALDSIQFCKPAILLLAKGSAHPASRDYRCVVIDIGNNFHFICRRLLCISDCCHPSAVQVGCSLFVPEREKAQQQYFRQRILGNSACF